MLFCEQVPTIKFMTISQHTPANGHLPDPIRRCLRVSLTIGACMAFVATHAHAEPAVYEIDPEHAVVGFSVDHLGFADVVGFFGAVDGSYVFDEQTGTVADVSVRIDTASVFTNHEDRDEHIRSDDFLDARQHATMSFVSTAAEPLADDRYVITGELSLLGVTRPLQLDATLNRIGEYPIGRNVYAMGVSATATVQRSEFGMTYGVDNGWVGDTVEIFIEFEARRQ